MQTIVFQTTEAGQCLTDCEIIPGIKIGSHTCTHCVNCLAFDSVENIIKCKTNEVKMEHIEREIEVVKVSKITGEPEQFKDHWLVPVEYKRKSGEIEGRKLKCASKREAISIYVGFSFLA